MKEQNRKYVAEYDWVRIFATVLVVIGHSCYLTIVTALGGGLYTEYCNWNFSQVL